MIGERERNQYREAIERAAIAGTLAVQVACGAGWPRFIPLDEPQLTKSRRSFEANFGSRSNDERQEAWPRPRSELLDKAVSRLPIAVLVEITRGPVYVLPR